MTPITATVAATPRSHHSSGRRRLATSPMCGSDCDAGGCDAADPALLDVTAFMFSPSHGPLTTGRDRASAQHAASPPLRETTEMPAVRMGSAEDMRFWPETRISSADPRYTATDTAGALRP